MSDSFNKLEEVINKRPLSLSYQVRLASHEELKNIVVALKLMGRQTMNFRTMPDTQALVLIDNENQDKIIGWHGFVLNGDHGISEKFSLHLEPNYRNFLLGLALETVLYKYLHSKDVIFSIIRMNRSETPSLLDYRMKTGVVKPMHSEDFPESWLNKCDGCELYKKNCMEQDFFEADVIKGIALGEKRLGPINFIQLPVQIRLMEEKIRDSEKHMFVAKWTA